MSSDQSLRRSLRTDANLLTRLDRAPVTRTLRVGIAVVVLVWLLESFDIGMVSVLILVLGREWALTPAEIGILGASGTVGLLAGMLPAGRLADLYGRKRILIVGTVVFSVFTALCAFAGDLPTLAVLRVLAGLGEGAIFPVPYLMISELVNKDARGRVMGYAQWVLNGGYTLPALAGLWVVGTFSADWSWRVLCLIGGLPLLLVPVLMIWVPESPRFRLRAAERSGDDRGREEVRRLVTRIEDEAGIAHDDDVVDSETLAVLQDASDGEATRIRTLLRQPYLRRSLIAYAALTASFVVWYTILTYAPTIFGLLGAAESDSLLYTAVMMLVSAFGVYAQGRLADTYGRKMVLAVYVLVAGVGMVLLTLSSIGIVAVVVGGVATAWFGLGSFAVTKMYLAEQYPTRLRGLGTGVGEMVSRGLTGGVLVALLPGLFAAFGLSAVLAAAAVVMVLLVLPMLFLGQETRGRNMEDLGADRPAR